MIIHMRIPHILLISCTVFVVCSCRKSKGSSPVAGAPCTLIEEKNFADSYSGNGGQYEDWNFAYDNDQRVTSITGYSSGPSAPASLTVDGTTLTLQRTGFKETCQFFGDLWSGKPDSLFTTIDNAARGITKYHWKFSYNGKNQLVSAMSAESTIKFSYDNQGNLITQSQFDAAQPNQAAVVANISAFDNHPPPHPARAYWKFLQYGGGGFTNIGRYSVVAAFSSNNPGKIALTEYFASSNQYLNSFSTYQYLYDDKGQPIHVDAFYQASGNAAPVHGSYTVYNYKCN
jgi:YD repeat-containing protein